MPKERPPPPGDTGDPGPESVEALVTSAPMRRFVEKKLLAALAPFAHRLRADDLVMIRARAFVELCTDPVLRGLVTTLARALRRDRRESPEGGDNSRQSAERGSI